MEDAKGVLPPSKKRVAGREISRDNPGLDDDDGPEGEMGTFQRASEEVLAARRIVKVRRQQPKPSSSSNPFAGLQLIAPSKSPDDDVENANATDEAPLDGHVESNQVNNAAALEGAGNISGTNVDDVEAPIENNDGKGDVGGSEINNETRVDKSEEASVQIENDIAVVNGQRSGREETDLKEQTEEDSKREAGEENSKEKNVDDGNKEPIEVGKEGEKKEDQKNNTAEVSGSFSSFQQLSCRQNAFSGLAGTGLSSTPFSFGLISKEGSAFTTGSGSLFGQGSENLSNSSTLIGNSSGSGSLQLFGSISSEASSGGGVSKPVMQEVPVETGEENEKAVFNADAILFEYVDNGWKERGKGELKLNTTAPAGEKARLVMRARGNYRLILNANLFPDMSLKGMDKRGVTFACINSATEGRDGFSTFALKFREASILEDFCHAVEAYKGKKDDAPEAPADS